MKGSVVATLGTCSLAIAGAVAGWFLFAEPASDAREVAGPVEPAVPVETAAGQVRCRRHADPRHRAR